MTGYREKCLNDCINCCWGCGRTDGLEVHHVDGDRDNNALDNLLPLCVNCHKKVHNEKVGTSRERIEALKDRLPDSKLCTIDGKSVSVTLHDEQWLYIYETQDPEETFSERVRKLVDKGMEVEEDG